MDYSFSEEQTMFRDAIRGFLESEWSPEAMKKAWDYKTDHPLKLYRRMGELGWLGLAVPEEYGGMGLGWVEVAILFEELGRALLKGPFISSAILGSQTILRLGSEEQKEQVLPKIARGHIVLAWALTEAEVNNNFALMNTRALSGNKCFYLSGQKLFVSDLPRADYIMTVARVGENRKSGGELGVFLVNTKADGLSYTLMDGIDGEELAEVNYHNVMVTEEHVISRSVGVQDIVDIVEKSKLAYSAEMLGGAERALEVSISYVNTRQQFGRLIGSFQAIQHKLATVAMLIERSRWLTYYAAYLCTRGIDCTAEINMAYLATGEAYRLACAEGVQVHGGSGCMRIHEIGRHFQRAKALQLKLEPAYLSKDKICQVLEKKGARYGVQIY